MELLAWVKDITYSDVLSLGDVIRRTKEVITTDTVAGKWRFADKKFAELGDFEFGKGPTSSQKEKRRLYPKVQVVFDRMNKEQLAQAFSLVSSNAFNRGYESGGAIDND